MTNTGQATTSPSWNHEHGSQTYVFIAPDGDRTFVVSKGGALGWTLEDSQGEQWDATTMTRCKREAHRRYFAAMDSVPR